MYRNTMNLRSLSLTFHAGLIMSLIVTIATAGMFAAVMIVEGIEGVPADINQAGSLRMMSMRIAHAYDRNYSVSEVEFQENMQAEIGAFEARLNSPSFKELENSHDNLGIGQSLKVVNEEWATIKKALLDREYRPSQSIVMMHYFASQVDQFVYLVQTYADKHLREMRLIIGLSLILTLLAAAFAVYRLYYKIVRPLRHLVTSAVAIQEGDFSKRVHYDGEGGNELGQLAAAFNSMASKLAVTYESLENNVNEKTRELRHRNQALDFLYTTAKLLSDVPNSRDNLTSIISKLEATADLKNIVLCLNNTVPEARMTSIFSASDKGDEGYRLCLQKPSCAGCYRLGGLTNSGIDLHPSSRVVQISYKNYEFGSLYYEVNSPSADESWCHQLVKTLAENLGTAFYSLKQNEHEHRLMLIEERTTIARELHDSLAQSLSFQKFQLSRFQMMLEEDQPKSELLDVIKDLRQGLNSAYSQLRELLTSFRLKLTDPGLEPALKGAVAEFSQRGELKIDLDYRIRDLKLSANEEVHVLQIVREALSNVVKHAKAKRASVTLVPVGAQDIQLSVADDGVGFPPDRRKINHHGLAIMAERAKNLSGSIDIQPNEPTGTVIRGNFQLGSHISSNEVSIGHV